MAVGGGAVNQKEQEESKCREFVDELNRLVEHERYRYIGHVSELEGKAFSSDCLIKDRRMSSELHVECTRFAPERWRVRRDFEPRTRFSSIGSARQGAPAWLH